MTSPLSDRASMDTFDHESRLEAASAGESGRWVPVGVVAAGSGAWHCFVSDNGLSIPLEQQDSVFTRMMRAHTGTELATVRPDASAEEVHGLMAQRQLRRLPVTDTDGRVVGVITLADAAVKGQRPATVGRIVAQICATARR